MNLILHADDYAYNTDVSKDIIDCAVNGTLHRISIIPNSPSFEQSMELLENANIDVLRTIHFSISEGPCLADKKELPLLVNEQGMFKLSFFKLLFMSFGPKRKELKREIKLEIKAQYEKVLPYLNEVNIDSHVHYHMIPLVLRTVLEVVDESGRDIEYIRIPAEPLMPFIKHTELWSTYSPINFVKNIVLNVLELYSRKRLKKYKDKTAVFFGVALSGHMDIERVSALLPDFVTIAKKRGMKLEVLAHPGKALSADTVLDPGNHEYSKAPLSEDRHVEKKMFMEIHKYL